MREVAMVQNSKLSITRVAYSSYEVNVALKILMIICTLIHDMVQATIITSYCLQAQLLQAHLMFLRERLLNRTMTPLNWMRVRLLVLNLDVALYL